MALQRFGKSLAALLKNGKRELSAIPKRQKNSRVRIDIHYVSQHHLRLHSGISLISPIQYCRNGIKKILVTYMVVWSVGMLLATSVPFLKRRGT